MNKPVYEVPVVGPDFDGSGSANAASYPPPVVGPILEAMPGEYPEPGSFSPSTAAFGAPIRAVPPGDTFGFPPPNDGPDAGYVCRSTAYQFSTPTVVEPSSFADPIVSAPAYVPTVFEVPVFEVPVFEMPVIGTPEPAEAEWSGTDAATKVESAVADADLLSSLQHVVLSGASDLHMASNAKPMVRIDGGLRPIEGSILWDRDKVRSAIMSILTPVQIATFEEHLELDLAYTISANARFRVNIYQERGNLGAAFRLIPTGIKQLSELGLPEAIARFATLARGLVLVTGPTGSGKSTTLAAIVDLVNRTRADHIVTVEDPIEFLHTNRKSLVNQREVGADTHSFANALKHVLRQDPDVILIGELRDLETISVALTAAETGHLVFATLHTQDAPQTIDRIIDVFPPHQQAQVRAQLAATLQGVVCQTLVKRSEGKGRAVVTEILVTTPAVANLIREGKTYQVPSAMQAGRELGMHTMDQHLAELVNSGQVTPEAALEKVHDAEGFKRLVHRAPTEASGLSFTGEYQGGKGL